MNKKSIVAVMLAAALLTLPACGSNESWENEAVSAKSDRLLSDQVKADWTVKGSRIQIAITEKDGKPVTEFDINHEKLLHLMVISKDLSYFNHIHPAYKGDGIYEIENEFPAGGEYRLIADFKPTKASAMTKMEWVQVEGESKQHEPVVPSEKLESSVNGTQVALSADQLAANKELTLTFTLADEKTNAPITDLQPYLGAIGHVVVLSENGEKYLHVHAAEGQGTGPTALFETTFPKSGIYKIWAQFQRANEVFTVPYVVNVP